MTQVFVVNSGSASIKYQLVDLETSKAVTRGIIERIGEPGGCPDHETGMREVLATLGEAREFVAVGHRVVHGGPRFSAPTLITDEVEAAIEEFSALAPLHNPPNLLGIRAARAALPQKPHVAVFDTAFHQSIPPHAHTYAIDPVIANRYQVRRYGFHGTSHEYVSREAARFLDRPLESLRTIVLHLGNGASATAIDGGVSVDTSMGLTPLEGLVMGTRPGDIDPGVLIHLARTAGMTTDDLDDLLNHRSGLLGLTGSRDMRDVLDAASRGDAAAKLALAIWQHRLRHYLGAYLAVLGGLDVLVFTAGIGENSAPARSIALEGLGVLGLELDAARNASDSRQTRVISPEGAAVTVLVVPTNEELEIARQTVSAIA